MRLWRRYDPGTTIVVPAWNVARYLPDCLDSLLGQTAWDQCRVVVVDDGSTDGTGRIADRYAAAHPQIQVVHQPNRGPGAGAARNRGLDAVQTEFVQFLDGDDELTPRAVGLLSPAQAEHQLDLAVGATEQFPTPREWLWSGYFAESGVRRVRIEDVPLLAHDARTCNKLYRTAWLRRSGLRFAERIHHQDTVVNVPAMLRVPEFALIGEVVHRYRKREDGSSVMDSHFTRRGNYHDHLQVVEELARMLPGLPAGRRPLLEAFIARSFQGFARRAPALLPSDELPAWFRRARRVVARLDPDVIEQATTGVQQRVAYVTMLEDDLASFLDLDALAGRLSAHQGDLYVAVPARSERTRRLLRTGATRAWADRTQVTGDAVSLRLRLRIRDARHLDRALDGIVLRVRDGESEVCEVPVRVVPDTAEGTTHTATVQLPRAALRPGSYLLRLGFLTPTGRTDRWVRRPPDTGDEVASADGSTLTLTSRDDRAVLAVSAAPPA